MSWPSIQSRQFSIAFYAAWLIAGLFQAYATELIHDEALYWMYANRLDWGYFYQPPMSAAWIWLSGLFANGELGVRLVSVLMSVLAIRLIELIIEPRDKGLFYLIISSIGIFHVVGILAVPDSPLFFFAASFLWLVRKYLKKDSIIVALLIGVNAACLLYSKYHGILIIGFALLANLKLFRRGSLYLAILAFGALMVPHVLWQADHGFPSVTYHLFDRSKAAWKLELVFNYLGGQLLLPGPIIGVVLLASAFLVRTSDAFGRTLKFCMIGILAFFFLLSWRGRVEANWTVTAFIPMIALAYNHILDRKRWRRVLVVVFPVSLAIGLCSRVFSVVEFPGATFESEWHGWDDWANTLSEKAEGRHVAFIDSYQKTAKYSFYTGETAHNITSPKGARGDWPDWEMEEQFEGEEVICFIGMEQPGRSSFLTNHGHYRSVIFKDFHGYGHCTLEPGKKEIQARPNSSCELLLAVSCRREYSESIYQSPPVISYIWMQNGSLIAEGKTDLTLRDLRDNGEQPVSIPTPAVAGEYQLYLGIQSGRQMPVANNARVIKVTLN